MRLALEGGGSDTRNELGQCGTEVRAMEGIVLGVGVVAVLVGLGALVEAARPRRGGPGRKLVSPADSGSSRSLKP